MLSVCCLLLTFWLFQSCNVDISVYTYCRRPRGVQFGLFVLSSCWYSTTNLDKYVEKFKQPFHRRMYLHHKKPKTTLLVKVWSTEIFWETTEGAYICINMFHLEEQLHIRYCQYIVQLFRCQWFSKFHLEQDNGCNSHANPKSMKDRNVLGSTPL